MRKALMVLALLVGMIIFQLPGETGAKGIAAGVAFAEDPTPPPTPWPPPPPPLRT